MEDRVIAYGRHVDVKWAPSSHMVAVTDYQGSDYARSLVFRLNEGGVAPEQISIEDLLKGTSTGRLLEAAGHRYVTSKRWNSNRELVIRARGTAGPFERRSMCSSQQIS